MNYKLLVYIMAVLFTTFSLSSVDLNKIFKQGKVVEANIFAIILILSVSGLLANFIIGFMEVSKII